MIAYQYARAYFPPTWRVMGRKLVPLTVGHALLLEAMQHPLSPLYHGTERPLGPATLALAVEACSRPVESARKWLARPGRVKRWSLIWRTLFIPRDRPWVPLAQFVDYRRFWCFDRPEVAADPGRGSGSEVPHLLSLIAQQTVEGCSREAILNTPCRIALWDAVFFSDASNIVKVKEQTPERIAMVQKTEEIQRLSPEQMRAFVDEMEKARQEHIRLQEERRKKGQ